MADKRWTVRVEEDPFTGDYIITLPDDLISETGWQVDDVIEWIEWPGGGWERKKKG